HLLDPQELSLEIGNVSSVEELETGADLPISPGEFRDRYRQLVERHRTELGRRLGGNRIDYIFTDISQPLDGVLYRYLADRARQYRTR
ncbi:MAG TPA: hypothetical protein VKB27_00735, partial [Gammaproteobacteria bacterium]|nr:hypothetical protein [Gammaproteobacteria bacterium]